MSTYREVEYDVDEVYERQPCDWEPTLSVLIRRRVVTTEHNADGSVTRHEAPWKTVHSLTYKHEGDDQ